MGHLKGIIAGLIIATLPGPASAQQEVILDHVTNSIGDSLLIAGNTHILSIRYRNFPAATCSTGSCAVNSGFILFSEDGATWNRSIGTQTMEFELLNWWQTFVNHFEDPFAGGDNGSGPNDGVSPDYLGFTGVSVDLRTGLRLGFDDIVYLIEIQSNLSDTGLRICIDSSSIGRLNTWSWACFGRIECSNVVPDWAGPYCFTIVQAEATCGDTDFDGQVTDFDLDILIDYYFSFGPPPDLRAADVNGDGTIDISDIIYLANYLHNGGPAPCDGTGPGGFDWKDKPDARQARND